MMDVTVEIRRGTARFTDRQPGRATWHTFSFGGHYDPDNVGFGPMVCHDEHLLASGSGFPSHPHRDLDIVTWVVSGALTHTDSLGTSRTVRPGEVAVLSAGSGVEHSEVAAAPATRFVQAWIRPGETERPPAYAVAPVAFAAGSFTRAAEVDNGSFHVARVAAGEPVTLPDAPLQHLFVASGALTRSSEADPLQAGDAFLIRGESGVTVTAGVPTELLLWCFEG